MLIESLLILFTGILAGTVTGLIPGIHINLISSLLIALSASIFIEPIYSIVFIIAMAITHTFLDFIPSIFLGCPDTDTELSILPGHEFLMNKKGYEAIALSNKGSLTAIFLIIIFLFPFLYFIKNIFPLIKEFIPYILIIILIVLLYTEKNKWKGLQIILLAGTLGYFSSQLNFNQPLLPLLTGLFGASSIIISLKQNTKIPEQKITKPKIKLKKPIIASLISAPICSFLPGVGGSQAAIMGQLFVKPNKKEFITLLGIINTFVIIFSILILFSIEKTRTGTAIAIKEILPIFTKEYLILILIVILITGTIAYFLNDYLSKYFAKNINKINYKKISYLTLCLLFVMVLFVSDFSGLLLLVISTLVGIYGIEKKVKRSLLMAVLIIPTIIFYLF